MVLFVFSGSCILMSLSVQEWVLVSSGQITERCKLKGVTFSQSFSILSVAASSVHSNDHRLRANQTMCKYPLEEKEYKRLIFA